ncbi:MAG TPA: glycosyltransferase family 2 protein [Vicinamibacteria bacterium]
MSSGESPVLSVVMPTHDRPLLLARALSAYDAQDLDRSFEVLVVDDGSRQETREVLRSFVPRRYALRPLRLDETGGPARARNAGLARVAAPLVVLVGDDIVPGPGFLAVHLEAHRRQAGEEWAILGRTSWPDDLPRNNLMVHVDGPGAQQFSYAHMLDGQELDFRHFYTSNVSFKAGLLERVRPWFDTSFSHPAYEDTEFAYRLRRQAGMRIRYAEGAQACHYHYYSVWTFSARQYRCGLMAAVLLRKHHELRRQWQTWRLHRLARLAGLPAIRGILAAVPPTVAEQLEQRALGVGSFFEMNDSPVADRLFLGLLEYFVLKGMLEGELEGGPARRASLALLLIGLVPHLYDVAEELRRNGEPRPEDELRSLAALAEPHLAAVRRWPRLLQRFLVSPVRGALLPRY